MYKKHGFKTQVLPASLTSTEEIMALAGVHHITIAPGLLVQLAEAEASANGTTSLFDAVPEEKDLFVSFKDDEKAFRIAFTRSVGGEGERKLSQVCLCLRIWLEVLI
jgi:transaldolase